MKNWKKWIAGVGIGLLVAVLGVGIWQKDNVQALWEAMSYDEEELKTQMETTKEKVQETLQEYEIEGIRDLTVEEEEKLMKGELSVEEALDLIMNRENGSAVNEEGVLAENTVGHTVNNTGGSMGATSSTESQGSTGSILSGSQGNTETNSSQSQESVGGTSTETTKPNTSQIVEKYVEKIYTLQATFLSELGGIEARARAVFAALPEDKRNLSTAQKLAPSFINQGLALESSCDSQVNALLSDFEAELKKAGASTTIVSNMREAYQTQKRLKKAYYLSAIK